MDIGLRRPARGRRAVALQAGSFVSLLEACPGEQELEGLRRLNSQPA